MARIIDEPEEIRLALLFSDTRNSTLDRLDERSELLIDISKKLVERHSGHISTLLTVSDGYLDGDQGIYNLLGNFEAYSDPFKKKSSLFVTLAHNAGVLNIKDINNIVPIMDYHISS